MGTQQENEKEARRIVLPMAWVTGCTYGVKGREVGDFGGSSLEPPRRWRGTQ